jgi:C-terminal processing protease CtpA/Prc
MYDKWRVNLRMTVAIMILWSASMSHAHENSYSLNLKNAIYLSKALAYIQVHALYASRINWRQVQIEAEYLAKNKTSTAQLYSFLIAVVAQLKDRHSQFETPAYAQRLASGQDMYNTGYSSQMLHGQNTVVLVISKSAAATSGLLPGDILINQSKGEFAEQIDWHQPGDKLVHIAHLPLKTIQAPLPSVGRVLGRGLGMLTLFSTLPAASITSLNSYAAQANAEIRRVDSSTRCGWVLDLRQNVGGNSAAMLLAVGPLLGEGGGMAYVPQRQEARQQRMTYNSGILTVTQNGQTRNLGLKMTDASRLKPGIPVAVLQGSATASAAEAVVVAFHGRPNTRFFGAATYGVPTGNIGLILSDGAVLRLTEGVSQDNQGRQYEAPIAPDVLTPEWVHFGNQNDPTLNAAKGWLLAQAGCR